MSENCAEEMAFATPDAAIAAVLARLKPVDVEWIAASEAAGRVLAEPIRADRDSPACDVSSVDGYAVRLGDLNQPIISVAATTMAGQPPVGLPIGAAVRIMTGAAVPLGAEAIVKREDTHESADAIRLRVDASKVHSNDNIRRRGENLGGGEEVVAAGTIAHPAVEAALATFGVNRALVYRKVRVGVIVTGDELLAAGAAPSPWQIRDSNGPALRALLAVCSWIEAAQPVRAPDSPAELHRALSACLDSSDVMLVTGGVSMGDRDYVPRTLEALGAVQVFHRLPVRPGKPILAAIGAQGQVILALPGNPVSALVGACRFASPICRLLAGVREQRRPTLVRLVNDDRARIRLWWWRTVKVTGVGEVSLVPSHGSGDLVSAARGDGFVEMPPREGGEGPWPFFQWDL